MKQFLAVLTISLLAHCALFAQDQKIVKRKNAVQLGVGGTLIGDFDHNGMVFFAQYQHKLNDYFSTTPRVSALVAGDESYVGEEIPGEEVYAQSSGISFDVDLNYAPFRRFKDNFYLSLGPSVRYIQQTYPRTVSKRRLPDGSTTFEVDQEYRSGFGVGGTAAINVAATVAPQTTLGARGAIQVYTDGPAVPFYGIVIGRTLGCE